MAKKLRRDTNITNGRQEVLSLPMSVCVSLAYKPHSRQNGHSTKPNSQILGDVWPACMIWIIISILMYMQKNKKYLYRKWEVRSLDTVNECASRVYMPQS